MAVNVGLQQPLYQRIVLHGADINLLASGCRAGLFARGPPISAVSGAAGAVYADCTAMMALKKYRTLDLAQYYASSASRTLVTELLKCRGIVL
jgi:hypothetical protein